MVETLYDQIAEATKALGKETLNPGDDDDKDDDAADEAGHDAGADDGRGAAEPDGGKPGEDEPRGKSGTPPEDAGAPSGKDGDGQEDGGGAQKDAQPPQEDGEDVLTNADWARQRRELREARAELARLKAAPPEPRVEAKPEVKPEVKAEAGPEAKEPDKNVNYQEWLEWKIAQADNAAAEQAKRLKELVERQLARDSENEVGRAIKAAEKEFKRIENAYKAKNPDYDNAIGHARTEYARAAKIMYPGKTEDEIGEAIDHQMLVFASECAKKGLDPAEELYDMSMERFGYVKAAPKVEAKAEAKEEAKPNLKMISNNRKRSASPLSGGGQGGRPPVTLENAALDFTVGEIAALSPELLAQLEEG